MNTATINSHATSELAANSKGIFARLADAALSWMISAGEASTTAAAARKFARLNALTDAELAEQGLTRNGLVHHCFDVRTGY